MDLDEINQDSKTLEIHESLKVFIVGWGRGGGGVGNTPSTIKIK
jgi:hypothetical protein